MDLHAVKDLISLLEPAEDRDGVLHRGLGYHNGLKTAFERRIGLDIFAVFVKRRGADAVDLTARQHGLEDVARVHRAVGLAGADDGVDLIYEQDYPALARLDLAEHRLESFLKLAAEFCAGDKGAHVEREHRSAAQVFGHVAAHDTLCQSLGYRSFADAGFTDKTRVVLRLTRKDAYDVSYFVVTPDNGVKLLRARQLYKILTVLFQCVVGRFGVVARHLTVAAHRAQRLKKCCAVKSRAAHDVAHRVVRLVKQTEHNVFDRDILVVHTVGFALGGVQRLLAGSGDVNALGAGTAHAGKL
ncbi:putative uncharacterized protein [Anaerotruncus sp. CAG:390]|nr:putative uncharacterized protein [Anaerotruncus sp. CAG:390]